MHFKTLVDTYNRSNEHVVQLALDSDTLAVYGANTMKGSDVMITNSVREKEGKQSPNVVGEIGYSTGLSQLTALAPTYLNDNEENHTELYFIVQLSYPNMIANPGQFQMVFILYDRVHMPAPVSIVSCGTLPVSEDVRHHIESLTGISQQTHPDRHLGYGYGSPPCTLANASHPHYTVTFGGAQMASLHRDRDLPAGVDDPDLYAFDISLFALQEEATRALDYMGRIDAKRTIQSPQSFEEVLEIAAAEIGGATVEAVPVHHKADHLCV